MRFVTKRPLCCGCFTSVSQLLKWFGYPVPPNYFPLLPMDGYFFFTAALTLAFSAGVPDCATRERAFLACASFSIGYFRLSGSAKDFVGSAFRAALVSFAMCHLIVRNEEFVE